MCLGMISVACLVFMMMILIGKRRRRKEKSSNETNLKDVTQDLDTL